MVLRVVFLLEVETGNFPGDFCVILKTAIRCYHGAEALMLYNPDPPLPACVLNEVSDEYIVTT